MWVKLEHWAKDDNILDDNSSFLDMCKICISITNSKWVMLFPLYFFESIESNMSKLKHNMH